ncbi:uncharacterized protein [Clytia hemisphaerica]|uniref:C2H2-type domain-containing protein n=1 Tax=Clytia hemisphaerica TaxID=252671 RepID=A0A7M5X5B2_9CNID
MVCQCRFCDERFNSRQLRDKHIKDYLFYPCLTCAQKCNSLTDLEQHCKDSIHRPPPLAPETLDEQLQLYLQGAYYLEKVIVTRTDRRRARIFVQDFLKKIMRNVIRQPNGRMYSQIIEPAGSTSTQTKIIVADEFDFNIVLKETFQQFIHSGRTVVFDMEHYDFEPLHQRIGLRDLFPNEKVVVPNGYVAPLHRNNAPPNITRLSYYQQFIPRWVQEDLYVKIKNALDEIDIGDLEVRLKCYPNGPAITMFIKHIPGIDHEISIDLSASIKTNIPVNIYGWPREETEDVLSDLQIAKIEEAGIILVPKHQRFWYISFSKAITSLMQFIDGANECRRTCHKVLKRDFKTWQSEPYAGGLKGISTYLFKHHLFWINEEKFDEKENYWANQNIGQCYMDMLESLAEKCRAKHLPNYFNIQENILENKQTRVLNKLAKFCEERRLELLHIHMR